MQRNERYIDWNVLELEELEARFDNRVNKEKELLKKKGLKVIDESFFNTSRFTGDNMANGMKEPELPSSRDFDLKHA